jgi:outer membrane lipoprotein SlyB
MKNLGIAAIATAVIATATLAGCASTSPNYGNTSGGYNPPPASSTCYDCGVVTRIDTVGGQPRTGTTGAVLGGVVGAVAGHELAKDSSKGRQNTATVAGAVGGAVAGSAIEKNMADKGASYNVYVRLDNGNTVTLNQADIGGIREGSYVRVYDGRVWAR